MPAAPLTRGPVAVRTRLVEFMASNLPPALATAREAWGLTVGDLPDPVRYLPYEPVVIDDRVPIVSVGVSRSNDYRRVEYEGEYQPRYYCVVYAWLKAAEFEAPQAMRDDFASVLTSVLLTTPSLGGGGAFRFEENTLEVSYSDAVKVKGDRWLTGVSAAFQVFHREQLAFIPVGSVQATTVTAVAEVVGVDVGPLP